MTGERTNGWPLPSGARLIEWPGCACSGFMMKSLGGKGFEHPGACRVLAPLLQAAASAIAEL